MSSRRSHREAERSVSRARCQSRRPRSRAASRARGACGGVGLGGGDDADARLKLVEMARAEAHFSAVTSADAQEEGLARALNREALVVLPRRPTRSPARRGSAAPQGRRTHASDPLILDRRSEIVGFGQAHGLPGFVQQFCRCRRGVQLWPEQQADVPPGRPLHRRDPERGQAPSSR